MIEVNKDRIITVITEYLQSRLADRLPNETQLIRLEEKGDQEGVAKYHDRVNELKARFTYDNWMEDAAMRRVFWQAVTTHISKGVHPDSRGNNVVYQNSGKRRNWVSSDTLSELTLDSTGNAAALDIFRMFNLEVENQNQEKTTILELIRAKHPEMKAALSNDAEKAEVYFQNFLNSIEGKIETATTYERNKQILWPKDYLAQESDSYKVLVPLHPVSFCHELYQRVNVRYSDENKTRQSNRYKAKAEKEAYFTMHDLAVVKLGGSNPQGVSQLTSQQGGRNPLLPSLPPMWRDEGLQYHLKPSQKTFFTQQLQRDFCGQGFRALFRMVKLANGKNQYFMQCHELQDMRKDALDEILLGILQAVTSIHENSDKYPAGWSVNYNLSESEALWLDFARRDIDDEFAKKWEETKDEWIFDVVNRFSVWVNNILKRRIKALAAQFDDEEMKEWRAEMTEFIKALSRKKTGGF